MRITNRRTVDEYFARVGLTAMLGTQYGLEQLNYLITSCMLVVFALLVAAKQYIGSPIRCYAPYPFTPILQIYAENTCFTNSTTYFIPNNQSYYGRHDPNVRILHYQWVPVFLALQAVLFVLPNFLWNQLHGYSGTNFDSIFAEAIEISRQPVKERKVTVERLATVLRESLQAVTQCYGGLFASYRLLGCYETIVLMFTKFLYLANVGLQLIIMNHYIGQSPLWGLNTLCDLISGRETAESTIFPRIGYCDVDVMLFSSERRYSMQCSITVNMYNEKIYLFLWFWFSMLLALNMCSFFSILINMSLPVCRKMLVGDWLRSHPYLPSSDAVTDFTHKWLLCDGVLALRFIEQRAGISVVMQLCQRMFSDYGEKDRNEKSGDGSKIPTTINRNA